MKRFLFATRFVCLLCVAVSCTPFEGGAGEDESPETRRQTTGKENDSDEQAQSSPSNKGSSLAQSGSTGSTDSPSKPDSGSTTMKPTAAGGGGRGGSSGAGGSGGAGSSGAGGGGGSNPPSSGDADGNPGLNQDEALNLGVIETMVVAKKNQYVGPQTPKAWYRFDLAENGMLTYGATPSSAKDAVTVLLFLPATLINTDAPYASLTASGAEKVVAIALERGQYFVMVKPYNANNDSLFKLSLSFDAYGYAEPDQGDPGEDKDGAYDLGTLTALRTLGGYVGGTDATDFYRFALEENSRFQLALTEIKGTVAYELYADAEILNPDKVLVKDTTSVDKFPTQTRPAGVYFLKIAQYSTTHALYKLSITPNE